MAQSPFKFSLGMNWKRSLLTQAAVVASFILFVGYLVNTYLAMESISSLTQLVHKHEMDKVFSSYLDHIKENHELKKKLLTERLKVYINSWQKAEQPEMSKIGIASWLKTITRDSLPQISEDNITQLAADAGNHNHTIKWVESDTLQVLNFTIKFPKEKQFNEFQDTIALRQRYQVLGNQIDTEIKPTLIWAHALVLFLSFLALGVVFLILARRFSKSLVKILMGFKNWSRGNFAFRFEEKLPGELGFITKQFNNMADNIERMRQKSLDLEKFSSWQEMAQKLAHEVKNPLTPIQLMVSQLRRSYKGDDEDFAKVLSKAETIITEEVRSLRRMVDHFNAFASLPQPEFAETDVVHTINDIVDLEKAAYNQHTIAYISQIKSLKVFADEQLLKQMLINFIKNAAEACNPGSTITLNLIDSVKTYEIVIADNGPGIPEEMQKKIFQAYFTTKHTGPSPGMGLGLAICQKIILDHDGEVSLQSKPGQTAFHIKLNKKLMNKEEHNDFRK